MSDSVKKGKNLQERELRVKQNYNSGTSFFSSPVMVGFFAQHLWALMSSWKYLNIDWLKKIEVSDLSSSTN